MIWGYHYFRNPPNSFLKTYMTLEHHHFSRKTFRRRVLQKIVGVSHTTHIPHISSTPHISHTYPFQTYPTHIPHISSTPHISHTYPFQTYPTHIQHTTHIPHISIPNVSHTYPTHIPHISSTPHISHTFIQCVSIEKVCIISYHCYSAGMEMKIKTLLFLQFLCNIMNWI